MSQKIPVLHIIKSLGRGGAEMLLPETLNQHDKDKYDFHYIYFLPWKNQVVEEITKNGGRVTCLSASNNLRIILKAREVASYIRKNGIRIVHCHLPWAGIVGRIAGKMTGVPVIYTEHNKWERYHKATFTLNKFTFPWQSKVIAVSNDVAESIKGFYKKENPVIDVVLNGVNTGKFSRELNFEKDVRGELEIGAGKKVIGIISVFRTQKRLHIWLEIASMIHKNDPDTFFIIVGDGPLKAELHQLAGEKNMGSYLHFAGLQTEVRPYLKAMDVFMMSSEFEGLPVALLESMSMGCIPACTMAGGIPELIKDGKNGILVPVDNPLLLTEKVSGLLSKPQEMAELREEAKRTVAGKFSMKQMVIELEKIYKQVLN